MRSRRYDGADVRRVLASMVTDKTVCSRISPQWTHEGLFESKWANLVAGLVVRYFNKYNEPPDHHITSIFEMWAQETTADEETIKTAERFIQTLSDEHERREQESSDYIVDLASKVFNKTYFKREAEAVINEVEKGFVDDAAERLEKIRRVNLGTGSHTHFDEVGEWQDAFETDRIRPLFNYKGDLADFVGDSFVRGRFFAFMGINKIGKTTYLVDLAYRACKARNRVAFFDVGDGDNDEMIHRLACRASGLPLYEGEYYLPDKWDEDKIPILKSDKLQAVDAITGYRAFRKICKSEDAFRFSAHPNSSLSVSELDGMLDDWEKDGWVADVVFIDYTDILKRPSGIRDRNDQIDEVWKQLRSLSQRRHCLVITATQANAKAYESDRLLGRQHFVGRRTLLDHANGVLGINVSPEDKEHQMARINWVVRRKGFFNETAFCRVAGCLAIGNPVIMSKM